MHRQAEQILREDTPSLKKLLPLKGAFIVNWCNIISELCMNGSFSFEKEPLHIGEHILSIRSGTDLRDEENLYRIDTGKQLTYVEEVLSPNAGRFQRVILRVEKAEGFEHFNTLLSPIHSMNELETELKDAYILALCIMYEAIMREGHGLSEQEEWENSFIKCYVLVSNMNLNGPFVQFDLTNGRVITLSNTEPGMYREYASLCELDSRDQLVYVESVRPLGPDYQREVLRIDKKELAQIPQEEWENALKKRYTHNFRYENGVRL